MRWLVFAIVLALSQALAACSWLHLPAHPTAESRELPRRTHGLRGEGEPRAVHQEQAADAHGEAGTEVEYLRPARVAPDFPLCRAASSHWTGAFCEDVRQAFGTLAKRPPNHRITTPSTGSVAPEFLLV